MIMIIYNSLPFLSLHHAIAMSFRLRHHATVCPSRLYLEKEFYSPPGVERRHCWSIRLAAAAPLANFLSPLRSPVQDHMN